MQPPANLPHLYRLFHDVYVFMDIADRAAAEPFGLSRLQFNALRLLETEGEHQLVRLANRLLVTRSTVTRFIDQLEARGLVRREDDPADRRAQYVFITAAGRALWQQAYAAHLAAIEAELAPLGDDQAELERLLLEVRAAVTSYLAERGLMPKEDSPAPNALPDA